MIALTLEMSGVPSLAFAVGVYLPLSSSSPIWAGGMVRWLVDAYTRRKHGGKNLTEDQLAPRATRAPASSSRRATSPGARIAGIVIALLAGLDQLAPLDNSSNDWATAHNPVFSGPYADALSMIFFLGLCAFLYLVGRETPPGPEGGRRPARRRHGRRPRGDPVEGARRACAARGARAACPTTTGASCSRAAGATPATRWPSSPRA